MLERSALQAALPTLTNDLIPAVHGRWARCVALQHLQGATPEPLWPGGGARTGARFTPKGGPASLYLATEALTVLAEVGVVYETPAGRTDYVVHQPYGIFCVKGIVPQVLDLTDPIVQRALQTNDQELRGPWLRLQGRPEGAPTQVLGQAAFDTGIIGGVKYTTAKFTEPLANTENLLAFPDRLSLNAAGYLEVEPTPGGHYRQRLP
jgi:RES domain-containing protein